jgi:biotin carboxylase
MAERTEPPVAVVDPIAAGEAYGEEGRAMGCAVLAVLSKDFSATMPYIARSFHREHYRETRVLETIEGTAAYLRSRGVSAVVPGASTALAFTDALADALGVIGNPVDSVRARADKRAMKECWAREGVPCAAFHESAELRSVLSWAEARGYPVVLKPTRSAGGAHVYVCETERDVAQAFAAITREPDLFGNRFSTVLAEEYLDGDEYFMDLVHTGDSPCEVVSVAKYDKLQRDGHASIYRSFRSLSLDDPVARTALPVVLAANAAIGVRYGINDTEFKLTSRGLRVIEVNNRLPGASTPQMIETCSGRNCYQDNIRIFLGRYPGPRTARGYDRHYCVCCLVNDRAGRVTGYDGAEDVERLPSFHSMRPLVEVGRHCAKTVDIASTWGLVYLVHEDPAQLDRDAAAVHGLMKLHVA